METGIANQMLRLGRLTRMSRQQWLHARPGVPAGVLASLTLIKDLGGCHAKELAHRAGLDPSTVSRAVAGMVGHGLVERRTDPDDGRASVLAVTERGEALIAEAQDWFGGVLDRALAGWEPGELRELTTRLDRFLTAVEAEIEGDTAG